MSAGRYPPGFELANELEVPEDLRKRLPRERDFRVFRYEVAIREDEGEVRIASERGLLMPLPKPQGSTQKTLFPNSPTRPSVFDRHGCGSPLSREEIEGSVESEVSRNGWGDRARAVVIDPELEEWVWSGSPVVAKALQGAPRATRRRRSARIFGDIAAGAPVEGCQDPAFRKLKATLQEWFARPTGRTASRSGPGGP